MHSESSGFARTWPSLPMSPELSGVVRAFRTAPAPEASRPLASGSLTGTTSRAFTPRASCVLASGRLSGVEPGMMPGHSRPLIFGRLMPSHIRSLTPPRIRKPLALTRRCGRVRPHAPVAPSKLMRFSRKQPQAAGESSETPAACTSFEAPRFSNGSRRSV